MNIILLSCYEPIGRHFNDFNVTTTAVRDNRFLRENVVSFCENFYKVPAQTTETREKQKKKEAMDRGPQNL